MNIEEVREFALSLDSAVTEDLFADQWISWRICGKWFLLMQLDAPEPRVAVKLSPEEGRLMREEFSGIKPAYHMNKTHWNDLYLNQLSSDIVKQLITASYLLVARKTNKIKR